MILTEFFNTTLPVLGVLVIILLLINYKLER